MACSLRIPKRLLSYPLPMNEIVGYDPIPDPVISQDTIYKELNFYKKYHEKTDQIHNFNSFLQLYRSKLENSNLDDLDISQIIKAVDSSSLNIIQFKNIYQDLESGIYEREYIVLNALHEHFHKTYDFYFINYNESNYISEFDDDDDDKDDCDYHMIFEQSYHDLPDSLDINQIATSNSCGKLSKIENRYRGDCESRVIYHHYNYSGLLMVKRE